MLEIKNLTKYDKKIDLIAVFSIILFLLLATITPSVKIFFVLVFLLFSFLTIFYSFSKAIIYTSFPLSYIGIAQIHSILVVPAKAIVSSQYWEGRHLTFGFSPYLIIATIALLMIPFWQKRFKKNLKIHSYEKIIVVIFGFGFLSAIYGSLISSLSAFAVFSQLVCIIWIWYLGKTLINNSKKNQQKILASLFLIISALIIYESLIVFKQTISQSPIGLLVEVTKFAPAFGLGSDENGNVFRPFGLQRHPNGLANNQLVLAFCSWLLFLYLDKNETKKYKKILILILSLATINIILSLSRAAFIAIFLTLIILFIRHKNQLIKFKNDLKNQISKIPMRNKIAFAFIGFFLIFKLTIRLMDSIYSFSEFGGISTREAQYTEALTVFSKSIFFGIGDRMFIPTSFQLFPKGVMSYFPEDVHNGFLLFTIERGIFGIIAYIFFIFLFYKKIKNSQINKQIKSVIYSGLTAGFTMMIFHPENNLLSNFVLLTIVLVNFNYEKRNDSKN